MTFPESEDVRRKSLSGHFRIWEDVFNSLEDEAKRKNVSLNTLVNQVLSAHTRDGVLWEEMGSVRLTKDAYRAFLSRIHDDELEELGPVLAHGTPSAMMLARKGSIDLDAVLDHLRFRSRFGWFSMQESQKNGRDTISFIHDFGPRESILLGAYLASLFGTVGVHPKITTTNSSVMVVY